MLPLIDSVVFGRAAHEAAGVAMLVGVPREIKDNEYRVGIVPSTVRELADKGHQVVIENSGGGGRRIRRR